MGGTAARGGAEGEIGAAGAGGARAGGAGGNGKRVRGSEGGERGVGEGGVIGGRKLNLQASVELM